MAKSYHRRLARGRNIRGPFFSQIRRDIPEEMFKLAEIFY